MLFRFLSAIFSVFVVHFLNEAEQVTDLQHAPIIKHSFSIHSSEHLMLVGDNHFEIHFGTPVKGRRKRHFEAAS